MNIQFFRNCLWWLILNYHFLICGIEYKLISHTANCRRFSLLPALSLRHRNAQRTALRRHQGFLLCPELTERPEWWLQTPSTRGWGLRLELHQTAMTPNSTMQLVRHSWKLFFYICSLFPVFTMDYQWERCRKWDFLRKTKFRGRKEMHVSIFLSYCTLLSRTGLEIVLKSDQAFEGASTHLVGAPGFCHLYVYSFLAKWECLTES